MGCEVEGPGMQESAPLWSTDLLPASSQFPAIFLISPFPPSPSFLPHLSLPPSPSPPLALLPRATPGAQSRTSAAAWTHIVRATQRHHTQCGGKEGGLATSCLIPPHPSLSPSSPLSPSHQVLHPFRPRGASMHLRTLLDLLWRRVHRLHRGGRKEAPDERAFIHA